MDTMSTRPLFLYEQNSFQIGLYRYCYSSDSCCGPWRLTLVVLSLCYVGCGSWRLVVCMCCLKSSCWCCPLVLTLLFGIGLSSSQCYDSNPLSMLSWAYFFLLQQWFPLYVGWVCSQLWLASTPCTAIMGFHYITWYLGICMRLVIVAT